MSGSVFVVLIPALLSLFRLVQSTQGGVCWSTINKEGRCSDILLSNVTKEECCKQFPDVETSWSKGKLDSGDLFFFRVIGGGVNCLSCKESCDGVDCGPGKKCVMRSGRPKCVCSPCKERGKNSKGPVCGSDGNTYLNVCRLEKRACRRKKGSLTYAYDGYCQSSCDRVKCPDGEYCLLDQNLTPHCVKCTLRCSKNLQNTRSVCGTNGVTYSNVCALRQTACEGGKAIPIAYRGNCKEKASCRNVQCRESQKCLTDPATGFPRCVTCNSACPTGISKELGGPICGTNNKTYSSWCHMIKDSCDTGFVIETKFQGSCEEGDKTSSTLFPAVTSMDNVTQNAYDELL